MAGENREGGFGWGLMLGAVIGFLAGAYLATGPGREQVETLRSRTIELTGRTDELRARAREAAGRARGAVRDPGHPLGRAIHDGVDAARRRRGELGLDLKASAPPAPEPDQATPEPPERPVQPAPERQGEGA
ncbi:MAG: hypothetical protein ACREPA_00020 [Candidatus Dormibacteraceae bacterium]